MAKYGHIVWFSQIVTVNCHEILFMGIPKLDQALLWLLYIQSGDHSTKCRKRALGKVLMSKHPKAPVVYTGCIAHFLKKMSPSVIPLFGICICLTSRFYQLKNELVSKYGQYSQYPAGEPLLHFSHNKVVGSSSLNLINFCTFLTCRPAPPPGMVRTLPVISLKLY